MKRLRKFPYERRRIMNPDETNVTIEWWIDPSKMVHIPIGTVIWKAKQHFERLNTMRKGFLVKVFPWIEQWLTSQTNIPNNFQLYLEKRKEWEEIWLKRPEIQEQMYVLISYILKKKNIPHNVTLTSFLTQILALNKAETERIMLYDILKDVYLKHFEIFDSKKSSDFIDDFVLYMCID